MYFSKSIETSHQQNLINEFRIHFHDMDILLFDDVHVLSTRPRHQEEFLSLITTLLDIQKQIVISSDRLPREIPGTAENVRSRLSGGLILKIHHPDFNLKKDILSRKCSLENINLSNDIISLLASMDEFDMNKLFRYIVRLGTISSLEGKTIDSSVVKNLLGSQFLDTNSHVNKIQKTVSKYFNISFNDLMSDKKSRDVSLARQIAMHICRSYTGLSFSSLGRLFGGKDHSTVLKAHKKIKIRLAKDEDLRNIFNEINNLLKVNEVSTK